MRCAGSDKRGRDEMSDREEIQQILNIYSDGASRRDFDQVIATFTADAIWEVADTPHRFVGTANIMEAFRAFTATTDYLVQLNAPGVIMADGDRATARTTIREVGRYSDRDELFDCVGTYHDAFVRTAGG
ncbi:MAG: nuclear transport factor 2 family protein, partial [Alphaproteobacteria bacterium]